jgi:hypothetical protein
MISFSPQGGFNANGTFDGCFGTKGTRPATPYYTPLEILAICIPGVVLFLTLLVLWKYRFASKKTRSVGLQCVLSTGIMFGFFLTISDGPFMACQMHGFMWVTHVALILPCLTVILLVTLLRVRYATIARTFDKNMMGHETNSEFSNVSDSMVVVPKFHYDHDYQRQRCETCQSFFQVLFYIIFSTGNNIIKPVNSNSVAAVVTSTNEHEHDEDDREETQRRREQATSILRLLSSVKRTRTLFIWVTLFYIPGLVALIVFYFIAMPYYSYGATKTGCYGCQVYWELVIILILLTTLFFSIIARLLFLLHGIEDQTLSVMDTCNGIFFSGIFYVAYFIVLVSNDDIATTITDSRWIVYGGLWCTTLFTCVLPVVRITLVQEYQLMSIFSACRKKKYHQQQMRLSSVSPHITLTQVMNRPSLMKSFELFSLNHWAIENVRFLEAVAQFKQYFSEKSTTWRAAKAKRITELFLNNNALLQINVSQAMREKVQKRVVEQISQNPPRVEIKLFDEVFAEVEMMLTHYGGVFALWCVEQAEMVESDGEKVLA